MENVILQLGSQVGTSALIIVILWWRLGEIKKSIDKLWQAKDDLSKDLSDHKESNEAHALNDVKRQTARLEIRVNSHINGKAAANHRG